MKYIHSVCTMLCVILAASCNNQGVETSTAIPASWEKTQGPSNANSAFAKTRLVEVTNVPIETLIEYMIQEEHFKGVVLATKGNEILHAKGYGLANDTTLNSIDTKFHVASMTKQFTASAILQLLEQEKINLTESINTFLPTQYRSEKWETVTIHHLLSHSSGITDYAVTRDYYTVEKGFCLGNTVDGMLNEAMTKELIFTPGAQFSYCNLGFTLLGQIIEHATGTPFDQYLKDKVLTPAGMHASFIHNTTEYVPAPDEAIGYRWDEAMNKHVPDDIVSLPVTQPDGNLVTTLNDFLKWTDLYVENDLQVLQQASLTRLTTPNLSTNKNDRTDTSRMYGYGLFLSDETISHPGYIVGFRSHFIVNPKENIRVVVFTNNVSFNPMKLSEGIYGVLE